MNGGHKTGLLRVQAFARTQARVLERRRTVRAGLHASERAQAQQGQRVGGGSGTGSLQGPAL